MNIEAQNAVTPHFNGGERILWTDRPRQGLLLRGVDAFMIPFSLVWTGFAVFWFLMASGSQGGKHFSLLGIPFILVGVYLIIGRFSLDSWQRSKTYYGLTDRRVIIISGITARSVKSLNLHSLPEISLTEHSNELGSITFGPTGFQHSWGKAAPWPGMNQYVSPVLEQIPDAKSVYDLIQRTQNS